jgi:formate dehydrogenase subunit gamma
MSANGSATEVTRDIANRHGARPELLIQILHDVQASLGCVPEESVLALAESLNLSRADVHGVVSFYHDFRATPPGKHTVKICQAEACQAMGSRELTRHAEQKLGLKLDESNADVTLAPVYCLGNCACAPAIMVDGKTLGRISSERFDAVVDALGESG